ncbi:MAG TPA: glutathione-dependent reductase [Gammaproteobacteria bacterium]|jgi:putative glutathione S-transferase|nr:glutathione-dependent reductase [Gammaproteobacteria bacterium]
MLVNGQWAKDFHPVQATDEEGGFVRQGSVFRDWISVDGSSGFKAEPGRYHLYVGLICPWASRTLMARTLKGLESVISVSVVNPRLGKKVWRFGGFPGATDDTVNGVEYVYQLYQKANPQYTGQITIPVLWDTHRETIVNNESADIVRMLNRGFGALADDRFDLYPQALAADIDAVNERLYEPFNNGVYRAGFATTQSAYDAAVSDVFTSLDYIEDRLASSDYLVGDQLTESDIRAFVTLVRFDAAYYSLFKTNLRPLRDYPQTCAYMQRIYDLPGIAETVSIDHIKAGYYSIEALNPTGIVPVGPAGLFA